MARKTSTDRALADLDTEIALLQAVRARLVAAATPKPARVKRTPARNPSPSRMPRDAMLRACSTACGFCGRCSGSWERHDPLPEFTGCDQCGGDVVAAVIVSGLGRFCSRVCVRLAAAHVASPKKGVADDHV